MTLQKVGGKIDRVKKVQGWTLLPWLTKVPGACQGAFALQGPSGTGVVPYKPYVKKHLFKHVLLILGPFGFNP
jgi:hypothetical protein